MDEHSGPEGTQHGTGPRSSTSRVPCRGRGSVGGGDRRQETGGLLRRRCRARVGSARCAAPRHVPDEQGPAGRGSVRLDVQEAARVRAARRPADGLASTMVEDQTIPDDDNLNTSPTALRGVHVHRPVHRPRHHLRQHSPRAAAGGSGRARQLPDTALRPRLDLRARAGAGAPVLRSRGPRQALAQAQRQRRPGRATRRCRTSRHPGAAQRREPHRRPAAPGPGAVPQPARRPGPVAGHPARVGVRDRPSADALALPVGRDARLPATASSATSWWDQRAPSTRRSPARRP